MPLDDQCFQNVASMSCCHCRTFSLLAECGLTHRDDCINCEMCYFCFDPAFVWPSLGHSDFHSA